MLRELIIQLYHEIFVSFKCKKGEDTSIEILEIAQRIRDASRDKCIVQLTTISDMKKLILCLEALQEYYTEIESLIISTIFNILLQNRGLLIELAMKEQLEYYIKLLDRTFDSCTFFITLKQKDLVVPKTVFQIVDYNSLLPEQYTVFDTAEERALTLPMLKLMFLLLSQKVPRDDVENVVNRYMVRGGFIFTIFLLDIIHNTIRHGFHDCLALISTMPLFIESYKAWYAFSCNYEEIVLRIAEKNGWLPRFYTRWVFFFDHLLTLCDFSIDLYKANVFFTLNRMKVKCALSVVNVILVPRWEMFKEWLLKSGIDKFYLLHVLVMKMCEDNLKTLDHDRLYSRSTSSFSYVNAEILPLVGLMNRLLEISGHYDEESGGAPNFTKAQFLYAFSGEAAKGTGTPEQLGLPEELIAQIPNLKPLVEHVLKEPLLIKLNKQFLQIYSKLELEVSISSDTPHFLNMRVDSGEWNLMAVNVANVSSRKNMIIHDDESIKEDEAIVIWEHLARLNTRKESS